jgi:ATP-binding cassette subfamily F protein 3
MRVLAGLEKKDNGNVRLGHNVQISYFGQHQAQELSPGLTVMETLSAVAGDMTTTQIRSLLGAFLFRGEEVDKKVLVLSGGEKSRLALAKMIVQPANLLILDEPTNHLDMSSQDVLQEAMVQYDGSIIIVSHNRHFVNGFVNKVLEIKDNSGTVYEGNIEDYLYKIQMLQDAAVEQPEGAESAIAVSDKNGQPKGKAARREQAKVRQEKSRQLQPFRREVEQAEKEIGILETRKKELEQQMADPELYKDEVAFAECSKEYKNIERRLERQYHKWEEAQGKVERVEAEFSDL